MTQIARFSDKQRNELEKMGIETRDKGSLKTIGGKSLFNFEKSNQ